MPYKKQKVIRRIRENKKGTFLCAQVVGLLKAPLYSKRDLNPLTSSLRHPKIFVKEFSDFLMSCHQHCLGVNLFVQR